MTPYYKPFSSHGMPTRQDKTGQLPSMSPSFPRRGSPPGARSRGAVFRRGRQGVEAHWNYIIPRGQRQAAAPGEATTFRGGKSRHRRAGSPVERPGITGKPRGQDSATEKRPPEAPRGLFGKGETAGQEPTAPLRKQRRQGKPLPVQDQIGNEARPAPCASTVPGIGRVR